MQITGLSQLDTGNAIAVAVAKKAMQAEKAQARAMIEMLKEAASTSGSAQASADGVGQRLDVIA